MSQKVVVIIIIKTSDKRIEEKILSFREGRRVCLFAVFINDTKVGLRGHVVFPKLGIEALTYLPAVCGALITSYEFQSVVGGWPNE